MAQDLIIAPLAERMRPQSLTNLVGHERLVGEQGSITRYLQQGHCPSLILWGNPGVGKTTLARLISLSINIPYVAISAISAGVKDIRETIDRAEKEGKILLFIDEIHRFNKSQQDALLKAVEEGKIILIGATTENPSFEVNRALLSRCQVYHLEDLSAANLKQIVQLAIEKDQLLAQKKIQIKEWEALIVHSAGDARKILNQVEWIVSQATTEPIEIDNALVESILQGHLSRYDKDGEYHYDIISAMIKSIRGSDPNAALYWLAVMIDGGEDPKFIARRLIILASEDIGMANPNALLLANACFDSVTKVGYPECSIVMAHAVVYLATSAKSNASYKALKLAQRSVRDHGHQPVPLHLRNAPTQLMKDMQYGQGYQYAHDFPGNFIDQQFLPTRLEQEKFYQPSDNAREREIQKQLSIWWPKKYL